MNVLAFIWGMIIALGIVLYIILDGFDLGIGILTPFIKHEEDRDIMISTILPVWDGNETWLVFVGACLYGAFPIAFSKILPAVYIPIILLVLSLLFRGVAFEFRLKAIKSKRIWDISFFAGSLLTTIVQGLILATFVQGFVFQNNNQEMSYHAYLNPFAIICVISLIIGYMLLGSNWLIMKTVARLQMIAAKFSHKLQYAFLIMVIVISVYTPFVDIAAENRWFNPHYMPYFALLPAATALLFILQWRALAHQKEYVPFWCCIGIFLMCYIGFIITTFPYIVPRQITYLAAAANEKTLSFMLIGAAIMLPILLFYTFYSYRLFRGKTLKKISY